MRKGLKNLLFIILVLFVGVKSVEAYSVGDGLSVYGWSVKSGNGIYSGQKIDGNSYNYNRYFMYSGGYEVGVYCIDPNREVSAFGNNYKVGKVLGQSSSQVENAYGYGVLEILSSNESYNVKSIALRAYHLGVFCNIYRDSASDSKTSAHINLALSWLGSAEGAKYRSLANLASKHACPTDSGFVDCYKSTLGSFSSAKFDNLNTDVLNKAKALFFSAIEKAASVMENGAVTESVKGSIRNNEILSQQDSTVNENIYANFSINNMDNSNYAYITSVDCPTCSAKGISINSVEAYDNNSKKWVTVSNNSTDISKFVSEKNGIRNGNVRIKINVVKAVQEDDCQDADFTINYKYRINSTVSGYWLEPKTSGYQRMITLITSNGSKQELTDKVSGTISCGKAACPTEIETPICSTDKDKAVATIKAPENIKKCILNNSDDAGNSYQLTTDLGIVNNDYCSVFCKEDYAEIRLNPVVENVVCGGYFQLKSHIKGSKDCYTSSTQSDKSINKDAYLEDIEKAQQTMVDAMNSYNMYNAMLNGSQNGNEVTWSYVQKEFRWDGENGTVVDGRTISETYTGNNISGWKKDVEESRKNAENELNKAVSAYKQIIRDYNSCTTGWTNEFKFDQKVKYEYNEYDFNKQTFSPYYKLLEDNNELTYLEGVTDTLKEDYEIEVCTGTTNDKYECQSGSYKYDTNIKTTTDAEYGYNDALSSVFSSKKYVVCTTSGCKEDTRYVSNARYVRKTVSKEQDYITPTAFYQIAANGKITINSGYAGDKIQLEALMNKLPISTQTTGGKFSLLLEDFGEFYSGNDLGRLIDFGGENESHSVAASLKEIGTFQGDYKCYYQSLCKACPDCVFECVDENGNYSEEACTFRQCPECHVECVNCIFDLGELQLNFKTISTTDINSAGREFGYNWVTSSKIESLNLISEKAEKTITEIEEANATIYNDKDTDGAGSSFSVKLTPQVISKIKEDNKAALKDGGYANDSLTCYDGTLNDGTKVKNIYCYSDYIDELIEDGVDVVATNRPLDDNDRKNDEKNKSYWQLWDGYVYNQDVIGGPAWK